MGITLLWDIIMLLCLDVVKVVAFRLIHRYTDGGHTAKHIKTAVYSLNRKRQSMLTIDGDIPEYHEAEPDVQMLKQQKMMELIEVLAETSNSPEVKAILAEFKQLTHAGEDSEAM